MEEDSDGPAPYVDPSVCAAVDYACRIVLEFFGPVPAAVCRFLFESGPSSLRDVRAGTGFDRRTCCSALIALIQHSYVQALLHEEVAKSRDINANTVYQADSRRIIVSVRQPAFLMHVADTLGDTAERVCAAVVHAGRLPFHHLVGCLSADPSNTVMPAAAAAAVKQLLGEHLLEQAPPCDLPLMADPDRRSKPGRSKQKRTEDERALDTAQQLNREQYAKQRFSVPQEVHAASLTGGHEALEDSNEVVLRLSFDAFAVHVRHQHCVDLVASNQGPECGLVAEAILQLMLPQDIENCSKAPAEQVASSVPLQRILQEVQALAEGGRAHEGLVVEGEAQAGQVAHLLQDMRNVSVVEVVEGGDFVVNQGVIVHALQQLEMSAHIKRRFGRDGHRAWRLLSESPHLQLEAVAKIAMLELRTARHLVYSLYRHGYLQVQEVPKTAERAPSKSYYLYRSEPQPSMCQLLADLFTAAGNLLARATHERARAADVLALAQRKLNGEHGVKLTAAQLAAAQRVRAVVTALNAALLRIDGMLAKFSNILA